MADKGGIVDLLAGFKTQNILGKGGIKGKKAVLEIKIEKEAYLNLDAQHWAAAAAKAITTQARTNMLAGLTPGGRPLPSVHHNTVIRRKYRSEQAARGGYPKVGGRYKRWSQVDRAKRNLARRYEAKGAQLRAQGPFIPTAGTTAGVESGMLARSIVAVPSQSLEAHISPRPVRSEGLFRIYVADVRGKRDGAGTSPMERAAAIGAMDFSGIEQNMQVQRDIQQTANQALANDAKQLLREIRKLVTSIRQLSEVEQ